MRFPRLARKPRNDITQEIATAFFKRFAMTHYLVVYNAMIKYLRLPSYASLHRNDNIIHLNYIAIEIATFHFVTLAMTNYLFDAPPQ